MLIKAVTFDKNANKTSVMLCLKLTLLITLIERKGVKNANLAAKIRSAAAQGQLGFRP